MPATEPTSTERVLSQLDSLPTLPAVAVKLLHLTALAESDAHDVVQLIRGDQSLTARILAVANSAANGVRFQVTTLERAVPLLGFGALRSIALATSVFGCFPAAEEDPAAGPAFDRAEFWKHALAVASAARRLAQLRPETASAAEDAFVAGLLHDLGKVALDAVYPKAYERIAQQANQSRGDIADYERELLGIDHTVAGRRLAERWRLPRELQETIWLHHLAGDALPVNIAKPHLIGLVQLADTLAREQRIGYSGNHIFYELSPRLAERLGFRAAELEPVVAALAEDVSANARLLGLSSDTPQAVYYQAMTRANNELGRLNQDLLLRNRQLAVGARYFVALGLFEEQLQNWADPLAVVAALAVAAAQALQRPRVLALGRRAEERLLDLCATMAAPELRQGWTEPLDDALGRTLDDVRAGVDALAMTVPKALREALGETGRQLGDGALWWLPIAHEGRTLGGVVYASAHDERELLAQEADELRAFLRSMGLALGRAHAQAAAQRLSERLAEANRRLQQMQVELLRSRTLSMIAEMAAGAGHELNTPLSVISGRAQMLAAGEKDSEAQRALQTIAQKAHECSGIVSELMDFARPLPPKLEPVDLLALAARVCDELVLAEQLDPERLRRAWQAEVGRSPVEPLYVQADREQLTRVLKELLANAVAAVVERASVITVRCQPALQRDMVELRIEDTGAGMEPAVLQRAFDPFFSHRPAGRSRGLGLARAYRIVEAHGGRIWLESRLGEGTTAYVLIPRAPGTDRPIAR